jgi:hypothetical protein
MFLFKNHQLFLISLDLDSNGGKFLEEFVAKYNLLPLDEPIDLEQYVAAVIHVNELHSLASNPTFSRVPKFARLFVVGKRVSWIIVTLLCRDGDEALIAVAPIPIHFHPQTSDVPIAHYARVNDVIAKLTHACRNVNIEPIAVLSDRGSDNCALNVGGELQCISLTHIKSVLMSRGSNLKGNNTYRFTTVDGQVLDINVAQLRDQVFLPNSPHREERLRKIWLYVVSSRNNLNFKKLRNNFTLAKIDGIAALVTNRLPDTPIVERLLIHIMFVRNLVELASYHDQPMTVVIRDRLIAISDFFSRVFFLTQREPPAARPRQHHRTYDSIV